MSFEIDLIKKEIRKLSEKKKAIIFRRFFKTKKGEYGEGDKFLGLTVPKSRSIAREFSDVKLETATSLLKSKFHEDRLVAILILCEKYKKEDEKVRKNIVREYLRNTDYINNWDLVDVSSYKIIGEYAFKNGIDLLYKLSKSKKLFERRIAIVSTYYFIKNGNYKATFDLVGRMINDGEDLMHKAMGWMLREAGKLSKVELIEFLKKNHDDLPRTTLRYAIERFSQNEKKDVEG